jgi:hypothetical protein
MMGVNWAGFSVFVYSLVFFFSLFFHNIFVSNVLEWRFFFFAVVSIPSRGWVVYFTMQGL